MKNVLGRFRKRNIQTNFYQFILVIFVVAVSVCLIAGLFINYLTLNSSAKKFFGQSNLPNLWIKTSGISQKDEEYFSSKFEFDKRYSFEAKYKTDNRQFEGLFLVSGGEVSTPYITQGEREKGCYVDSRFAEKNKFGLNYSTVSFDYEFGGETKKLTFKIVGFVSMAEDLIIDGNSVIFIDEDYFLEVLKRNFVGLDNADLSVVEYNELLITSNVTETDILDIENYYKNSSSELVNFQELKELESLKKMNQEIKIAKQMLFIFPTIFVLISVLVVVSAISQLVLKERYNIGLLKSLGISNYQIISNYCGYGTFICFIGVVLGVLIAPIIIPNMTFEVYDKIYNLPRDLVKINFPINLIIIAVLIAVLIGYLSALFVIFALIKKTPKECMSRFSKTSLKSRKKKKRLPTIFGASRANMKLNLTRTIMSVVGISGSSLLMLLGFGVEKIMESNLEHKEFFVLQIFSEIFKGFSIVLLVLTIWILIVQIFKERLKEMAVRRIHGEAYIKIWLSVLFEMLFIGVIGFVVSVMLSGPAMLLNLNIFGINDYFAINFLSYFKTFLIVFLLIFVIAGFGIIKILKLKLSESVKFSE